MNDNVVKLDDHRPHQATYVACLACGKDWVAVAPSETLHFQCLICNTLSGVKVEPQNVDFFNAFMKPVKIKEDRNKRTMVILNAERMIREGLI